MDALIRRKKVLFLLAHLHKGGMQKAVSNITKAIGDDLELFVAYYGTENPGFYYKAKEQNFDIAGAKEKGFVKKIFNFKKRLSVLERYVENNQIDVVVSFGETASVINLLSNHSAKKVISIRVALEESLGSGPYGRIYKFFIRWLYPKADEVISVSLSLAKEVNKYTKGRMPISVINNLYFSDEIKEQAVCPLPVEYDFLLSNPYIVNVGSYCHQKGQDLLIEAFSRSRAYRQGFFLVLVGRGPDENILKSQASELGVREQVIFTGFQSNPYSFIEHAELFVLSSRYEGFPNVLIEAMILGKSVVSFDCPTGPKEILVGALENCLVDAYDIDDLSRNIDLKISQENLENGALTARAAVYDYIKVKGKWISVLSRS